MALCPRTIDRALAVYKKSVAKPVQKSDKSVKKLKVVVILV